MAWSISGLFSQTIVDILIQSTTTNSQADLDVASALKIALYDNSITPDITIFQNVTRTNINYGSATFGTTGSQTGTTQVYHTGQWAQAGPNVASFVVTNEAGAIVKADATDTASGSAATMSNIYGSLIYVDAITAPTADVGLCALYFGGTAYSVTNGTFTVQYNGSGIFTIDVA
jgi:hypothetical protein